MRAIVTMGSALGVALALPVAAFAHGGSHPTPWPTPGTPTPGGTPPPSGKPPSGGTRGTGAGPAASTGGWEKWWELNKWSFTSVARTDVQLSGGGDVSSPEEQSAAKTTLTKWLTACLSHEYYDIRSAAALALGKAGDKTASEALVKLIGDENREVREAAVLALGLMKDSSAIPILVKEVFESVPMQKQPRMRAACAIALGFIGDKSATPEIVKELQRTKDDEVKYGCIGGLGLLKDESGVEPLFTILMNTQLDKYLRAYAASALGKCGLKEFTPAGASKPVSIVGELVKRLLSDKEEEVRQSAVLAIGAIGDEGQFEAIYNATEDKNRSVQNFAIVTLPRLAKGDKYRGAARKQLEGVLGGRNHDARGFAAVALGLLGDPSAAPTLRKSFTSESDPSIKAACAVGIGLLKDKGSMPMLQGVIMGSNDTNLMGYCCIALGLIGDSAGASTLKDVVKNSMTPELKAAAAIGLANIGSRDSIPVLLDALKENKSSYARQSTIVALGYFRDVSTIKPMQAVYDDAATGNDIRAMVIVSLGYVVDRFPRPVFKQLALDFNYLLPGEMTALVLKLF